MLGGDSLHLDLVFAVPRIDVVELLLARRPCIGDRGRVKRFWNSNDRMVLGDPQTQIVQFAPSCFGALDDRIFSNSNDRPEIKIVSNTALLIIDARMVDGIGINPAR